MAYTPLVTRGTTENIPEQLQDIQHYSERWAANMEILTGLIDDALAEVAAGGMTQETCTAGVRTFKKIHKLQDNIISDRLVVMHHCLQMLLPEGVSEGNKC